MLIASLLNALSINRKGLAVGLALLLMGLGANIVLLIEGGTVFRKESAERRADVTAAVLASRSIGSQAESYVIPDGTIDPENLAFMPIAEREFGNLVTDSSRLGSTHSKFGPRLDFALINLLGVSVEEVSSTRGRGRCKVLTQAEGAEISLSDPSPTITARAPGDLLVRKYGQQPGFLLTSLMPNQPVRVVGLGTTLAGWRATVVGSGVSICR